MSNLIQDIGFPMRAPNAQNTGILLHRWSSRFVDQNVMSGLPHDLCNASFAIVQRRIKLERSASEHTVIYSATMTTFWRNERTHRFERRVIVQARAAAPNNTIQKKETIPYEE